MRASAAAPLVIAVSRSPLSAPFFVADATREFAANGVDVRIRECLGGHRCVESMNDAEAHAATASDMVIMTQALRRSPVRVLTTFVTSGAGIQLIAGGASGVTTPAELRGTAVGYTPGTASEYFLDSFLLFHGVELSAPRRVPVQPEAMPAALASGRVGAVATWQPWTRETLNAQPGATTLDSAHVYTLTFNLVTDRAALSTRRDEFVGVVKALQASVDYIERRPDEARRLVGNRLDLGEAEMQALWPTLEFELGLHQSLLLTLEAQTGWATRQGPSRHRAPNLLEYLAPEVLREVAPEAVTVRK